MKTRTFEAFSDPGHGWAKVHMKLLVDLGIEDKITSFSYVRGMYAYLEEDCDLTTFVNALNAAGIPFKLRARYAENASRIRNYLGYTPDCARRVAEAT